jgi:hypothetical protein
MKALCISITLLFLGCALPLFAQNPLVGTWERQTNFIRATKIITPTHWAIIIDSLNSHTFVRSHGGTYTLTENNYIEQLNVASWDNQGDRSFTDYTYKVVGDKFYQIGTLVLSDGSVAAIDEVWQKVSIATPNPNHPAIGAWNLVSSSFTGEDGKKDNAVFTRFELITPTHWLRISHRNYAFESAMGGTYSTEGNKVNMKVGFASFPLKEIDKIEATDKVKRQKRISTGIITAPGGKTIATFEDVYQQASSKPQQTKK